MAKPVLPSGLVLVLVAPAMAVGLLALSMALRPWEEQLLIEHWQARIDALTDDEVPAVCGQLAEGGEVGIRVLAGQLGSDRDLVSRAVHAALRAAIDGWQEDSLIDASPKLLLVAQVLAKSVDAFGPAARERAADLARHILLWPTDGDAIDRTALVAHCHKMLRVADVGPHGLAASTGMAADLRFCRTLDPAPVTADVARPVSGQGPPDRQVRRAEHTSPGREPDSLRVVPSLSPPLAPPDGSRSSACPGRPAVAGPNDAPGSQSAGPGEDPGWAPCLLPEPCGARPITRLTDDVAERSAAPRQDRLEVPATTTSRPLAAGADQDLKRLSAIDVMRRLHDAAPENVAAAEVELRARGLTATQIDLARQLTDSKPSVRRRLIDSLPDLPSLDARPWLLWLSTDDHADVRLAALTVMATSSDPNLLRRVEQIASQDRDPRIAALGKRVLEHQLR